MTEEIKRPGVGLGVILMRSGYVLLGKRKNAHGEGTWSFPGGHIEFGESLVDCAIREMEEETGLLPHNYNFVELTKPFAATNDIFSKENKHYITLYLRASHISGIPEVMEPNKCEKWEWFGWNKLADLDLFTPVANLRKERYNPFE